MIYMEPHRLGWRDTLVVSWINKSALSEEQKSVLILMIDWLIRPLLQYLRKECVELSETSDASLVVSLMNVFECMFVEATQVYGKAISITKKLVQGMFLFSMFWSACASVNEAGRKKLNDFVHLLYNGMVADAAKPTALILENQIPEGSIYDYLYEIKNGGSFKLWVETLPSDFCIPPKTKYDNILVPTIDTARYGFLTKLLASHQKHILFVGPTGTGKSLYTREILMNGMDKEIYIPVFINFSAQTTSNQTQDIIESKLDKRRKGIFGPTMGKKCIIFVDDMNMPARETYGAQPPIELLRQWMDHNGWYNLSDNCMQEFVDIQFIGAMGPPGGGRNHITPRVR
jgi:dynein heavy chain